MRIFLIDDEPFMLKLLGRQLTNLGFTDVVAHARAHDALTMLDADAGSADVVFCDLQMPVMDGIEVVRHLARIGYTGGLALVSGEDPRVLQAAESLAKAHKLNLIGVLHKPVSPEQLQSVLGNKIVRNPKAKRAAAKIYEPEELRLGITRGELENYYQPKVTLATGKVSGVEALVRWRHPQDGLVFPDQFIGVAEENDLINELTNSVLTAALRQARVWQDAGLNLRMAVNVSMDNLVSLKFPDTVARAADEAGLAASCLMLEVTESRLMKNPIAALDILTRLRLKRIGLSIDDFGTGHSSLAQLRDIPFDQLKVDRSFVHRACHEASLRAIFNGSLSMARQLGMETVAEGVETRDDWDFLRAAGCDLAQGYFIAKPMPATDLIDWIGNWSDRSADLGY